MTVADFTSYEEMAEEADRYERELETWMEDHGPSSKHPRPEHNIAHRQRRLAWVRKCGEIFRRGAEADKRKQVTA